MRAQPQHPPVVIPVSDTGYFCTTRCTKYPVALTGCNSDENGSIGAMYNDDGDPKIKQR